MEKLPYHSSIQEHLVALSQLDGSTGPVELICGWFDDLYFPSEDECPSGYPREVWERGQREWRECFSFEELAVLADFHQIFIRHVDNLEKVQAEWRLDPGWLTVRDAAKEALGRFRLVTRSLY